MFKASTVHLLSLVLGAAALSTGALLADPPATQPSSTDAVTAWDGSSGRGSGWITPKADTNTITGDGEAYKGKKSIQLKAAGSGFIGAGWNWIGYFPADAGTDTSNCDRVRFYVKLTGDAKPKDFSVHLNSNNKKPSKTVQLSKYVAKAGDDFTDGNWHEIIIPLKDLAAPDFDPKAVWEIDLGQWSPDNENFTLLIDSIQFLPADVK